MTIRPAESKDCEVIVALVRELAIYEKLEHLMVVSADGLRRDLFCENPVIRAIVADGDGEVIGYAMFFRTYSTFLGKAGIWLEDLYVKQAERGTGTGKALLAEVGRIAAFEGAGRLEWSVLDWNEPAIGFYKRLGADILGEWRICRVEGDQIEALARSVTRD